MSDMDKIPWRKFVTKPIEIEAVEIGKDLKVKGLPDGDFIIRNPDPLEADGQLHCPREQFLEHYREQN